jgi:hypothetical protein
MKKATLGRRRNHDDALADAECSFTPKKERGIYGMLAGGAIGLVAATAGFFIATTRDRQLQKVAGAPAPKPGLKAGLAAAGAVTVGAIGGRFYARRKPTC